MIFLWPFLPPPPAHFFPFSQDDAVFLRHPHVTPLGVSFVEGSKIMKKKKEPRINSVA